MTKLRILVACEYSNRVSEEFRKLGHEVYSCDLRETEGDPKWHIQGDAVEAAYSRHWDMMIAHPYCTYNTGRP